MMALSSNNRSSLVFVALMLFTIGPCLGSSRLNRINQVECEFFTNRLYVANRNLGLVEKEYLDIVSRSLQGNCLSNEGEIQSCSFSVVPSNAGDAFRQECTNNAVLGAIWTYQLNSQCSKSESTDDASVVDIQMSDVFICASVDCTADGVKNLISDSTYLESLSEAGYTCESSDTTTTSVLALAASGAIATAPTLLLTFSMTVTAVFVGLVMVH
ncbi:hypothetical protein IV203_016000 [Nitzschia inconspicua]|uniref:Uncharacterized protein n=1 Tax=Nitzschia inconspicua TaxID=303405 RepID=A0A9K3KQG4_9STRA|nr:hypothetical protein IV203_016000 [Nitzschia inconspicua]